jgi:Mg2+-importing ATPase
MVPLVLLVINGFTKGDWGEAFLFALSVAVGLTPEMLPMIVTSTLAKGAVVLSRQKVIVKRLDAIQNFGAMDVLCTDKTGTLTQDRIVLERHTDVFGQPSDEVLKFAYLNSHYQTGLKNLLDRAVLEHVEMPTELRLAQDYRKVDEIPFDFERRRMSVVVAEQDDHHELICKGARGDAGVCTQVRIEGAGRERAGARWRAAGARARAGQLNAEGLRVVAVAMKEIAVSQTVYGVADESGLTLIGYVAFLDPPKESTALRAPWPPRRGGEGADRRQRAGHRKVCARWAAAAAGAAGPELERMDDAALAAAAEEHQLFAADPAAQGAHRGAARQRPRGGLHGRRHQRRAGPARGRHRHLGGQRGGHRQGGGRHHPAGKSLMVLEEGVLEGRAPSATC